MNPLTQQGTTVNVKGLSTGRRIDERVRVALAVTEANQVPVDLPFLYSGHFISTEEWFHIAMARQWLSVIAGPESDLSW